MSHHILPGPVEQRRGIYLVKDLKPGDVLRTADQKPLVVHDVVPVVADPDDLTTAVTHCRILWEPDGQTATTIAWETPIWQQLVADGPDAHYPVCATCGEVWPCVHTSALDATQRAVLDEHYRCEHCGKSTSGCKTIRLAVMTERGAPRNLVFHGRKGPCLTAARRLDPKARADW